MRCDDRSTAARRHAAGPAVGRVGTADRRAGQRRRGRRRGHPPGPHAGPGAGRADRRRVVSLFDQNEATRVPGLVDDIKAGATVLVVSDAGMPLINDPGYRLVAACVEAGLPVSCLPGPSAVTTALAVSGLPSDRFCFEGFAPRKQSARRTWLAGLAGEPRTVRVLRVAAPAGRVPARRRRRARRGAPRGGVPRADQDPRGGPCAERWPSWPQWAADGVLGEITVVLAGARAARRPADAGRRGRRAGRRRGCGVKDACAAGRRRPIRARRRGVSSTTRCCVRRRAGRATGARRSAAALCRHSCHSAIGIGVGGDAAADAEHRAAVGVELDGADRHVELAARDR